MDPEFWQQRWQQNQIGFHQQKINSRLKKLWPGLGIATGSRVLVPLCGKSLDMLWLWQAGYRVLGVELSAAACEAFFRENDLPFEHSADGIFERFAMQGIELLAGDFFALSPADTVGITSAYDRAALVALPADMRPAYAAHLAALLPEGCTMLLIGMGYDESRMQGPPFSVQEDEVRNLFSPSFGIEIISTSSGPDIVGNLKQRGLDTLEEKVYRLTRIPA
jgi:thiopurine S-methyltransferase